MLREALLVWWREVFSLIAADSEFGRKQLSSKLEIFDAGESVSASVFKARAHWQLRWVVSLHSYVCWLLGGESLGKAERLQHKSVCEKVLSGAVMRASQDSRMQSRLVRM